MTKEQRDALGILMMIIGALIVLVTIWWWAFFGLSENVGTASGVTAALFGVPGLMIFATND